MSTIREFSYGIIPLKHTPIKGWQVLLVQHGKGHWSFPKGHPESGETPQETAIRELQEETGLTVDKFISDEPISENYFFFFQKQRIYKTVSYYIALVKGKVTIQKEEIGDSCWIPLDQAAEKITFKEARNICQKVAEIIKNN